MMQLILLKTWKQSIVRKNVASERGRSAFDLLHNTSDSAFCAMQKNLDPAILHVKCKLQNSLYVAAKNGENTNL